MNRTRHVPREKVIAKLQDNWELVWWEGGCRTEGLHYAPKGYYTRQNLGNGSFGFLFHVPAGNETQARKAVVLNGVLCNA